MTHWPLFFTFFGVAVFTAQFFRLIDLIERPGRRHPVSCSRTGSWKTVLQAFGRTWPWMFWKS